MKIIKACVAELALLPVFIPSWAADFPIHSQDFLSRSRLLIVNPMRRIGGSATTSLMNVCAGQESGAVPCGRDFSIHALPRRPADPIGFNPAKLAPARLAVRNVGGFYDGSAASGSGLAQDPVFEMGGPSMRISVLSPLKRKASAFSRALCDQNGARGCLSKRWRRRRPVPRVLPRRARARPVSAGFWAKAVERLKGAAAFWAPRPQAAAPNFSAPYSSSVIEDLKGFAALWRGLSEGVIRAILDYAGKYAVDPNLVAAIVKNESGGNPNAVSRVGAQGLGQLMPETARRFGVSDPFDVRQNVMGTVRYLKFLAGKFDGDKVLMVAAYNAGEGRRALRRGLVPRFKETIGYLRGVFETYFRYTGRLVEFHHRIAAPA